MHGEPADCYEIVSGVTILIPKYQFGHLIERDVAMGGLGA